MTRSGAGTVDLSTGVVSASVAFAVTTAACTTVQAVSSTETLVDGVSFAWSPEATIGAGLLAAGVTGVRITIDAEDFPHLRNVALAGCLLDEDEAPEPATVTPTPSPLPTGLITGVIPPAGVALLAVNASATPVAVVAALEEGGCEVGSIGVTVAGKWLGYSSETPAWVNARFPATLAAGTPFVVRCL